LLGNLMFYLTAIHLHMHQTINLLLSFLKNGFNEINTHKTLLKHSNLWIHH